MLLPGPGRDRLDELLIEGRAGKPDLQPLRGTTTTLKGERGEVAHEPDGNVREVVIAYANVPVGLIRLQPRRADGLACRTHRGLVTR